MRTAKRAAVTLQVRARMKEIVTSQPKSTSWIAHSGPSLQTAVGFSKVTKIQGKE